MAPTRDNRKLWRGRIPSLAELRSHIYPILDGDPPHHVKTYRDHWHLTVGSLHACCAQVHQSGLLEVPDSRLVITPRDIAAINELLEGCSLRLRFETARRTADLPNRYRVLIEASLPNHPLIISAAEDTYLLAQRIEADEIMADLSIAVCTALWQKWLRMSYFEGGRYLLQQVIDEARQGNCPPSSLAEAHIGASVPSYFTMHFQDVLRHATEASRLSNSVGDASRAAVSDLMIEVANLVGPMHSGDQAVLPKTFNSLISAADRVSDRSDDRFFVGLARHSLGGMYLITLDHRSIDYKALDQAMNHFHEAVSCFSSSRDSWYTLYSRSVWHWECSCGTGIRRC